MQDSSKSLYYNHAKREAMMKEKRNKINDQIEELSIRAMFIEDAPKMTEAERKEAKDTYQIGARRRKP